MAKVFVNCELVKKLMAEKNISMANLSKQIGSTPKTLSKWLDDGQQEEMLLLSLIKIGRALDVDFRTLIQD